eukprot:5874691-Amphidinium_carterae.1
MLGCVVELAVVNIEQELNSLHLVPLLSCEFWICEVNLGSTQFCGHLNRSVAHIPPEDKASGVLLGPREPPDARKESRCNWALVSEALGMDSDMTAGLKAGDCLFND